MFGHFAHLGLNSVALAFFSWLQSLFSSFCFSELFSYLPYGGLLSSCASHFVVVSQKYQARLCLRLIGRIVQDTLPPRAYPSVRSLSSTPQCKYPLFKAFPSHVT